MDQADRSESVPGVARGSVSETPGTSRGYLIPLFIAPAITARAQQNTNGRALEAEALAQLVLEETNVGDLYSLRIAAEDDDRRRPDAYLRCIEELIGTSQRALAGHRRRVFFADVREPAVQIGCGNALNSCRDDCRKLLE